jgi:hypothetical protein
MQSIAVCWLVCYSRFADRCQLGDDAIADLCYGKVYHRLAPPSLWPAKSVLSYPCSTGVAAIIAAMAVITTIANVSRVAHAPRFSRTFVRRA